MSICDWDKEDVDKLNNGLKLLGWHADNRLTSDDALFLNDIAIEALKYKDSDSLSPEVLDRLSYLAFEKLHFQIMNIEQRSMMVISGYSESMNMRSLVTLIDQSLLCYYSGYFTAALAILFIVLERYLRYLLNWKAGDKDPTFLKLKMAIYKLSKSEARDNAERIISIIYDRYDAANPPQFYFNRHGLLHGIREQLQMDRLNCVRM